MTLLKPLLPSLSYLEPHVSLKALQMRNSLAVLNQIKGASYLGFIIASCIAKELVNMFVVLGWNGHGLAYWSSIVN